MNKKFLIAALIIGGCHPVYAKTVNITDKIAIDAQEICELAGQGGNTTCTEILHDDYLRAIYNGVKMARSGTTVTSRLAISETVKVRPCDLDKTICLTSTKHNAKWMVYGGYEYSQDAEIYDDLYEYFADDREFFY